MGLSRECYFRCRCERARRGKSIEHPQPCISCTFAHSPKFRKIEVFLCIWLALTNVILMPHLCRSELHFSNFKFKSVRLRIGDVACRVFCNTMRQVELLAGAPVPITHSLCTVENKATCLSRRSGRRSDFIYFYKHKELVCQQTLLISSLACTRQLKTPHSCCNLTCD